jgi:hypothetical protein
VSNKYGELTVSSAAGFNKNTIAPASKREPLYLDRILPPPDDYAISAWDDLATHPVNAWSPFDSAEDFYWQVKISAIAVLHLFLSIWKAILLLVVVWWWCRHTLPNRILWEPVLLFCCVYPLGYLTNHVETRFVWSITLLLTGIALALITGQPSRLPRILLTVLIVAMPAYELFDKRFSSYHHRQRAQEATGLPLRGARIAAAPGLWADGLYLAYYTGAKFYGVSTSLDSLRAHGVEYYLRGDSVSHVEH